MLCAKCGAPNADTSPFCSTCGALLEMRASAPAPQDMPRPLQAGDAWSVLEQTSAPSGSAEAPSFAPVARIPFQEEPLPQPSQPLPAVVLPAGGILTFTPPSFQPEATECAKPAGTSPEASQNRLFADYPTDVRVPVPMTPPSLPVSTPPVQPSIMVPPTGYAGPKTPNNQTPANVQAWVENTTPFPTKITGSVSYWENDARYAAPARTVNPLQTSDNNYHGQVESVFRNSRDQDGGYAPFPPPTQTPPFEASVGKPYSIVSGNNGDQGGTFSPFQLAAPAGPSLGNVYPGLPRKSQDLSIGPSGTDMPLIEVNQFVQPLPIWVGASAIVLVALILVGLVFLNADWATGALIASVIALILAVLLSIANGMRMALGMLLPTNPRRRSQVISAILLLLLLFVFSGLGMSQQKSLHAAQARYLEGQRSWQIAVSEFQAAGEVAPGSINLARVYNEWGESLSKQQQYTQAVTKFDAVLNTYKGASAQVQRARTDLVSAYLAWGHYASQQQQYATATSAYDAMLALSFCESTCQAQGSAMDATAYYNLAEQQLGKQQYTLSVNAFTVLSTRFPNAPETKKSTDDYAKALWGLGQQQLASMSTCPSAVKTYQQLAKQFGSTSQGQQAASALQKPVTVKGHFTTTIPGLPAHPTVALVQNMYNDISNGIFVELLDMAPTAQVKSDGTFTFLSVAQGTYTLVWSYDGKLNYYYARSGTGTQAQLLYKITLGPLCTYDYGAINQTIAPPANG